MGESNSHMVLVNLLANWIADSLLCGDHGYIMVDSPDSYSQNRPPKIYDFVPDVFVINAPGYEFIIGEAKTARDVDSRHTMKQVEIFLRKCAESEKSFFVLAVPWYMVGLAESIVEHYRKKIGVEKEKTKVLEKLPG